ncbi:MAG: MAPEG family protein [Gammaproteobacteria bacterium]|jgi:uncharacterized MAPEG superfamily protein
MDISIWCVFVAFLLIYLTRLPVVIASRRQEGYLEIGNPREQQARLTGVGSRAQAAHQNTLEAFAPFAAAVWVAHYGNTDPGLMNTLAVVFVALRVLYVAAYLADLNPWRTVIWMAAMFCVIGLFLSPLL